MAPSAFCSLIQGFLPAHDSDSIFCLKLFSLSPFFSRNPSPRILHPLLPKAYPALVACSHPEGGTCWGSRFIEIFPFTPLATPSMAFLFIAKPFIIQCVAHILALLGPSYGLFDAPLGSNFSTKKGESLTPPLPGLPLYPMLASNS